MQKYRLSVILQNKLTCFIICRFRVLQCGLCIGYGSSPYLLHIIGLELIWGRHGVDCSVKMFLGK